MNTFQILNCSSDLGNCCNNRGITAILSPLSNIINLIQIIVPILLLIMVTVELTKLTVNPDEKKGLKKIKNMILASILVFFTPIIVNVFINMLGDNNNFDVLNCIKQNNNIKLESNSKYIKDKTNDEIDTNKVLSNPSDYEKGEKRKNNNSSLSTPTGEISNACVLGDSNVKLVPNDSKKVDKVVAKVNGQEVANYAKSWLNKGLTYSFGSTMELRPGGHCDCSHFVYKVLMHFNLLEGGQIRSTVWGSCGVNGTVMYSSYDKLVPGDVVFKSFGNAVGHVEIYIGNGETIGCNSGLGVTHGHNAQRYTSFIHLTAYD